MDLKDFYSNDKRLRYNPASLILSKRFKNYFISFDDRFIEVTKSIIKIVKASKQGDLRLLDIGVGDGVYEKLLPTPVRGRLKIYGIDISSNQLLRAKPFLKVGKVVDLNVQKIPYKKNFFDIVLVSELLEHVFFPEKIISEALRVLKKDGYLIITYPNSGALQLRLSLFFWGRSPLLNYPANQEHIRFFDKSDILTILGKVDVQSFVGLGSFLFAKWNFPINIYTPRLMELFGNRFLPGFALGNLIVIQK